MTELTGQNPISLKVAAQSCGASDRVRSHIQRAIAANGAAAILIALWLAWAIYGIHLGAVNSFETGVYVNGGARLLQGQHVYTDFFSIYGPLTYYPFALTQLFTSNPHVSSQIVFISFALLDAILAYFVARGITSNRWLQLLVIASSLTYSGGGFRLPLALAAVLCVMKYAKGGGLRPLTAAGGFAAANLAIQQDMAAYVLAAVGFSAIVITLARLPRQDNILSATVSRCLPPAGAIFCGFVAVAGVFMAWLASLGSATAYIHDAFVLPLKYYDTLHMGTIPRPWATPTLPPGVVSMWARFGIDGLTRWFFYTLPFYWVPGVCAGTALTATFVLLRKKLSSSDVTWWGGMLMIAILGLCMSRSILKTGDEIKLKVNSLPAAILVVGISGRLMHGHSVDQNHAQTPQKSLWPGARFAVVLAAILGIFEFYPLLQSEIKGRLHPAASMQTSAALDGITALDIQRCGNADIARVALYLRSQSASGRLYCVPCVPILYVITGMNNATAYDYLDPIIAPEVCAPLVKQLRDVAPEYVVVYDGLRFWDQYEFGKEFGVDVAAYISEHYTDVYKSGNYRVLRLKPEMLTSAVSK